MILADSLETFPGCPTFGFAVEPRYLVRVTEREGGYERRDRRWSRPLVYFNTVPSGDQAEDDIATILEFWHAMGGAAEAFRFKDWSDFKSCSPSGTPAALDQPIAYEAGSPGGYRLTKEYTVGSRTQVREIYKPAGASIAIANDSGVEQDPSTWTIDEGSGLVVPAGGFAGVPATWGGEFYVRARFVSFELEVSGYKVQQVRMTLRELRPEE